MSQPVHVSESNSDTYPESEVEIATQEEDAGFQRGGAVPAEYVPGMCLFSFYAYFLNKLRGMGRQFLLLNSISHCFFICMLILLFRWQNREYFRIFNEVPL